MVDSSREVCTSFRVGEKNPKSVSWNDMVKAAVERKKVLGAKDEAAKERCMKVYKRKREVKR